MFSGRTIRLPWLRIYVFSGRAIRSPWLCINMFSGRTIRLPWLVYMYSGRATRLPWLCIKAQVQVTCDRKVKPTALVWPHGTGQRMGICTRRASLVEDTVQKEVGLSTQHTHTHVYIYIYIYIPTLDSSADRTPLAAARGRMQQVARSAHGWSPLGCQSVGKPSIFLCLVFVHATAW